LTAGIDLDVRGLDRLAAERCRVKLFLIGTSAFALAGLVAAALEAAFYANGAGLFIAFFLPQPFAALVLRAAIENAERRTRQIRAAT